MIATGRIRSVAAGCGLVFVGLGVGWIWFGPVPAAVIDQQRFAGSTIVDRNGVVLYEPLSMSGGRGRSLRRDELPEQVVGATVAAEDKRFFTHYGIDPIAVARALVHDIRSGRVVEGGSTLTQQVAKLLLGSRQRSFAQKVRESILAVRLERRYGKREILTMYLNLAPYGNQIHGIGRASRSYFGCAPSDLTPAQAAFLAALPQRPSAFNPLRDGTRAIDRQRYVLARMALSPRERTDARRERLQFRRDAQPLIAQHFVEEVLSSGIAHASEDGRIVTTLDSNLQGDVAGIIHAQRRRLLWHGARSVAVAVLDNHTGQWLAWEGSGDYFGDGFGGAIDGVLAQRQPGSTLKPFTYAVAFEQGFTPATVLADVPSNFPTAEEGVVYTPRNYDGVYRGPMTIRAALAGSENVPAVAMLSQIGAPALLRALRDAGFSDLSRTSDYYGLGLTLGDAEVRLDQLVTAYATLARGGWRVDPTFLPRAELVGHRQLFSRRTAFWITDILSDPDAREFVFGSGGSLDFPFAVAVKTGTSQAYRDNWTVGYTRDVTVGVWVGNFDRSEMHNSTGITGAAPIFHAVMLAAVKRVRGSLPLGDFTTIVDPPANTERVEVCALSGLQPSSYCRSRRSEWLAKERIAEFCSWHHDNYVDWPAEYRAWAAATYPRGSSETERRNVKRTELRVVNPAEGATFLIDPTLRSSSQRLKLRATAPATWHVDDRKIAGNEWSMKPGKHTISASDGQGNRDTVRIFVK